MSRTKRVAYAVGAFLFVSASVGYLVQGGGADQGDAASAAREPEIGTMQQGHEAETGSRRAALAPALTAQTDTGMAGGNATSAGGAGAGGEDGSVVSDEVIGTSFEQGLPGVGPNVIKRADLEVRVGREKNALRSAVDEATDIAGRFDGFVVTTSVSDSSSGRGTVVIRVPASNFELALRELSELGTVRSETISGKDVSQEFVDLRARLRNLRAQETVLLRLMDQARSVSDTIRVQRQLERIQFQIERIRGRLRFLNNQTDLSTISAYFFEPGAVPRSEQPKASVLGKAWRQAVGGFLSVVAAVIVGAGYMVPLALLAGIGLLIFRQMRPRVSG